MTDNNKLFIEGFKTGLPIAASYLAVAFTFGLAAQQAGLTPLQAVAISVTNFTSAGQFAALGLISMAASYGEMALTQLVINLRYCLMSCSLAQKLDESTGTLTRLLLAGGVTDEIFGLAAARSGPLEAWYNYGLMGAALPAWGMGTWLGAAAGCIMPERLLSALGFALYGMFLAVIIPAAKAEKHMAMAVGAAMLTSLLLAKLPLGTGLSGGFRIIIVTVLVAGAAAVLLPLQDRETGKKQDEQECTGTLMLQTGEKV